MTRTAVVGAICLLLGCVVGSAQGKYFVYGHGTQSCGAWSAAGIAATNGTIRDLPPRFEQEAWVVGFVSGVGYQAANLKETDAPGIIVWMNSHCAAHPLDTIATAAETLTRELHQP